MFLVSTMDGVEIRFTRKKQCSEDTSVGSTKEPLMLKLAYFSWNQNYLYVIELVSLVAFGFIYSLFVSKCSVHLSSQASWLCWRVKWLI